MRDASDCSRLEIIENCHEWFIIMEKAVQFSVAHHAVGAALQPQPPFLFHRNVCTRTYLCI